MGKKYRNLKIKPGKGDLVSASALPLHEHIERSKVEEKRAIPRIKKNEIRRNKPRDEFIDGDLSSKILDIARRQHIDEKKSESNEIGEKRTRFTSFSALSNVSLSDDNEEILDDEYVEKVVELDAEEEAAIEKFLISKQDSKKTTLFDLVNEAIKQNKVEAEKLFSSDKGEDFQVRDMDPEVIEMFKQVGLYLSKYRSGKIPKAFKIIPKMVNWEEVLYLTNPDKWSAAAMYQATRIFASNLSPKMCQRFYTYVLLPRLRDDIDEYKMLNFHLYQALHKAMFKPQAFLKGIILPLCQSSTCTLREATIFGSVLTKCSIPMLHAAATIFVLSEMDYSGSNSLFLRILIDKKFSLPRRAIDALVNHFLRFRSEERRLPVLWHQSLLSFVQRYKNDIYDEHRSALLDLLKVHHHHQISVEVRRELEARKLIDDANPDPVPMDCS